MADMSPCCRSSFWPGFGSRPLLPRGMQLAHVISAYVWLEQRVESSLRCHTQMAVRWSTLAQCLEVLRAWLYETLFCKVFLSAELLRSLECRS